jgi:hypothetical protein
VPARVPRQVGAQLGRLSGDFNILVRAHPLETMLPDHASLSYIDVTRLVCQLFCITCLLVGEYTSECPTSINRLA